MATNRGDNGDWRHAQYFLKTNGIIHSTEHSLVSMYSKYRIYSESGQILLGLCSTKVSSTDRCPCYF